MRIPRRDFLSWGLRALALVGFTGSVPRHVYAARQPSPDFPPQAVNPTRVLNGFYFAPSIQGAPVRCFLSVTDTYTDPISNQTTTITRDVAFPIGAAGITACNNLLAAWATALTAGNVTASVAS